MKKILTSCVLFLGVLFLIGCGQQQAAQSQQSASTPDEKLKTQISEQQENTPEPTQAADNSKSNDNPMELKIETTKQGTGDRVVKAGDTISVLYTGKLTDGTKFDSSFDHGGQPFSFKVGAGQVIAGWDQGLPGAKIGEKRTLIIPSSLGYGAAGIGGVIPPNATLIFDVELVSIQ
jgi:FKBP-type peptidyl-prolyl cis-trans isomerase